MGLKEIDFPIFSHQPKEEKYKCLRPTIFGYQVLICSRCFGLYAGFLASLIIILLTKIQLFSGLELLLLFILSAIGFANWINTKIYFNKSSNLMRVLSGFCLGVAMAIIVSHILKFEINVNYITVPIFYSILYLIISYKAKIKKI